MKKNLYEKEIVDLTQDELYEILKECGISSAEKTESETGNIFFVSEMSLKYEKFEDNEKSDYNSSHSYRMSCSIKVGIQKYYSKVSMVA